MYRVATFLLREWWGSHSEMADALAVLLLTWNNAFYRYGPFSAIRLEASLKEHWNLIEQFHSRDITDLTVEDEPRVRRLFQALLKALSIVTGKRCGHQTPVGVAKALHLLAPKFFPPWDDKISREYGCYYGKDPAGAYVRFCRLTRNIVVDLKDKVQISDKTLLKQIDEYNYARYSRRWM
jgi:hypothetical protein